MPVPNSPKDLSTFLKGLKADGNTEIVGEGAGTIKRVLSEQAAPLLTLEDLIELEAHEEVHGWFEKVKESLV